METGRVQDGKDGFQRLAATYPDNALLCIAWADICLEDGNTEEAEQICSHILEIEPKHIGGKMVYAKCLAARKQYHEAKDCAYEIMRSSTDNPMLIEQMAELLKEYIFLPLEMQDMSWYTAHWCVMKTISGAWIMKIWKKRLNPRRSKTPKMTLTFVFYLSIIGAHDKF